MLCYIDLFFSVLNDAHCCLIVYNGITVQNKTEHDIDANAVDNA